MPSWLILLRDLVWSSIFAILAVIATVLIALFVPNNIGLILGTGLSAISLSILALRS